MFLFVRLLISLVLFAGTHLYAQNENGFISLLEAAKTGDIDTVNTLIKIRADVNEIDDLEATPLIWAARKGHAEVVQVLIDAGANVNASDPFGRIVGETPLMWAIRNQHIEIAQNLVAKGGGVDFIAHPVLCARYLLQSTKKRLLNN